MEVTINIPDEILNKLKNHIGYYNLKNELSGENHQATLEEVIIGALKMYLQWTSVEGSITLKTDELIIEQKYIDILKEQGVKQKELVNSSGISKSAISSIYNGGLPSFENFIRIWVALGEPPIQHLLSVKRTE